MAELCIIGSSNTIYSGSYAHILKKRYGENCDIFGLGTSTSLFGLFTLLEHDIIGRYKYVLFQLNLNETMDLANSDLNRESTIAYLVIIISLFLGSESRPAFILLPYRLIPVTSSSSYIYNALKSIFNITIFDFEQLFRYIPNKKYGPDYIHAFGHYQQIIADTVANSLPEISAPTYGGVLSAPKVSLFDITEQENIFHTVVKGTSLLRLKCLEFKIGNVLQLPSDTYIFGIEYWYENKSMPYLKIENDNLNFIKILNCRFERYFLCRELGYSLFSGIKGGTISLSLDLDSGLTEPTPFSLPDVTPDPELPFYIRKIILADQSIYKFGLTFLRTYMNIFNKYDLILNNYLESNNISYTPIKEKFLRYLPEGNEIIEMLQIERPDIFRIASRYTPYEDIYYIFWCWIHGRQEIKIFSGWEEKLSLALKKIHSLQAQNAEIPQFTFLIYFIWQLREDLHKYDPHKYEDQVELVRWFYSFGMEEYDLAFLLSDEDYPDPDRESRN